MANLIILDGKLQFSIDCSIINYEFLRITTIQSKFPQVSYFVAWNDGWSPIRNKNAYAFFNNPRIINRGQIDSVDQTTSSTSTILYNFSNGIAEWKGSNIVDGPWQSNEFVFKSTDSLKADIQLTAGGQYTLYTQQQPNFEISGRKQLIAQARTASWGFANNGQITAKLYIKAGSSWTWFDSGSVQLNSNTATAIVLDLNEIPSDKLYDIKEIGIQYESNAYGDRTSVYFSCITIE
jgi:mannan endo-1,4-beta-mannosidase